MADRARHRIAHCRSGWQAGDRLGRVSPLACKSGAPAPPGRGRGGVVRTCRSTSMVARPAQHQRPIAPRGWLLGNAPSRRTSSAGACCSGSIRVLPAALTGKASSAGRQPRSKAQRDVDGTRSPDGAISQQELDDAVQALRAARRTPMQRRDRNTQLDLDWTRDVMITGIAGIAVAQVGDLITETRSSPQCRSRSDRVSIDQRAGVCASRIRQIGRRGTWADPLGREPLSRTRQGLGGQSRMTCRPGR
jgi:hypothetical protein